jgi:NADH:ubiquinone oxidoreductase subunit 3 (subunit A)
MVNHIGTIDRWLSSSMNVHRRQMSSFKNVKRGIVTVICLSSLVYSQIFYCYEANRTDSPTKCYGKTIWCCILIDLQFTFLTVIIPSLLMVIFGVMTVVNIHHSAVSRIQPMATIATINARSQHSRKTEHYLVVMLFVQVTLLTLFSLPQAIQNLYSNITLHEIKSASTIATDNFIFNLFFLLAYVTNGMPFYIYTLTGGTVFRQALLDAIKELVRKISCRIIHSY